MADLARRRCVPCRGGVSPLKDEAIRDLLAQLRGWSVVDSRLTKTYAFQDFADALAFVNRVGAIAEREGHHPEVYLAWGKVKLEIWTHKVNGLTENDFILAAKADEAL